MELVELVIRTQKIGDVVWDVYQVERKMTELVYWARVHYGLLSEKKTVKVEISGKENGVACDITR